MKIENNKIDNLLWRALSNTEKPSDLLIQKVKRDMAVFDKIKVQQRVPKSAAVPE